MKRLALAAVLAALTLEVAAVVATQLWHHTYVDGSLADLPSKVVKTVNIPA